VLGFRRIWMASTRRVPHSPKDGSWSRPITSGQPHRLPRSRPSGFLVVARCTSAGHRVDAGRHARPAAAAKELGARLPIDMKSMHSRDLALDLVLNLLDKPECGAGPPVGLVLQAAQRDSEEMLKDSLVSRSCSTCPLQIKFVGQKDWRIGNEH
jgi:hypothetical protein